MGTVRITQVRSRIGATDRQKKNLDALGLTKINKTVTHTDSKTIMGMLEKVKHLVTFEVSGDSPAAKAPKAAAKAAPAPAEATVAAPEAEEVKEAKAEKAPKAEKAEGEKAPKAAKAPAAKTAKPKADKASAAPKAKKSVKPETSTEDESK